MINWFKSLYFSTQNNICAVLVFFVALITYTLTLEPTTSFWDCGEYIATAHKIQVGHPPGAPFFVIIANFFSNLAFGNSSNVAWMINFMSALCSALTIVFLFWIITNFSKKLIETNKKELTDFSKLNILFSGIIGALIYTFSDSFWFSAVEGEVYAMSSLFTAIVFWSILKWENEFEKPYANRWLVLISFLIGLSVGVHMLNLLAIPAISSIYLYKKWTIKKLHKFSKFTLINIIGIALLGLIFFIIVPQTVNLFGKTELYFVNTLGFSFNSGTIFFLIFLTLTISLSLIYSHLKRLANLNTAILSFLFFLIGYSSFFVLIIRSNANTPIDENSPEDAVSLLAYLNREQYGSHPLIYGHSFNSTDSTMIDGNPVYVQGYELKSSSGGFKWKNKDNKLIRKEEFSSFDKAEKKKLELQNIENAKNLTFEINDKYIISDDRKDWKTVYKEKDLSFFPRMWSSSQLHINGRSNDGYLGWSGKQSNNNKIPTFLENLRYFWNYQFKHMYVRYFMWNFSGKQNDTQGHGNILDGNWITGFNLIDNYILGLGPQKNLPKHLKQNAGHNKYYMLPFLLGLLGLVFQLSKRKKDFWAIFLLFFFTGIAIVIQLNQHPYQPRERDYAYVGSFFAFSIWTGLGTFAFLQLIKNNLYDFLKIEFVKSNLKKILSFTSILLLGIPTLMAYENWDDHDRSNRFTARDFAKNYLSSCKPNAILFTMGDNDTFPLWYVQEVEGYRTDVRIVNLSLLNTDWYIDQMKKDAYDGKAVPFSMERDLYKQGTRDVAYYYPYSTLIDDEKNIKQLEFDLESIKNENPQQSIEIRNYLNNLSLMISKGNRSKALEKIAEMIDVSSQNYNNPSFLDSINASEKIFELSHFNNWIKSDKPYTKINVTKNKAHVYFPMKKIKFPVNKNIVIKNNIVSDGEINLIEENLLIDFSKNNVRGLDKKSLMILDLLEQNNWNRPIYFAITIGDPNQNPEPFMFLNDYLQLDGMVYQLTPIKNSNSESGRIKSDILYDNLMTKYSWGGIDKNKVYIDETNARMIRNFKNIFNRLASKLLQENNLDKAGKVIKKSLTTIKPELIPLEIYDLPLLENYFDYILETQIQKIGSDQIFDSENEFNNLNKLIETLIARYKSELKYYNQFSENQLVKDWIIQNQIKLAAQSLNALFQLRQEIPTNNLKSNFENDIIYKDYFDKMINMIELAHTKKYKNEAQNLFIILTSYAEIANTNKYTEINNLLIELERISNLINPIKKNTVKNNESKSEFCSCIEQFTSSEMTINCDKYLSDFFNNLKSEKELNQAAENCPEVFQVFIQQQMKAAEEAGNL